MIMLFKNNSTFHKFLSSYLAILFIPIAILLIFFYTIYNNYIHNLIMSVSSTELNKSITYIDNNLTRIFTLPAIINTNSIYNGSNEYDKYLYNKELSKYTVGESFISYFFYYDRGTKTLFNQHNSFNLEYFNNRIYNFEDWDYDTFINDIQNSKEAFIRYDTLTVNKNSDPKDVIIFGIPSDVTSATNGKISIVIVMKDTLEQTVASFGDNYKNIMILDKNNDIICSSGDMDSYPEDLVVDYIAQNLQSGYHSLNIKNQRLNIIIESSSVIGWKYVAVINNNLLYKPIKSMAVTLAISLLCIFACGSVLIFYMIKVNYNPIKEIYQYIIDKKLAKDVKCTETDIIKTSILEMYENLQNAECDINRSKAASKEFVLLNLIKGVYADINKFNSGLPLGYTKFTFKYYMVAVVSFAKPQNIDEDLITWIEDDQSSQYQILCKYGLSTQQCVIVVSMASDCKGELHNIGNYIFDRVSSYVRTPFRVGIGKIVSNVLDIKSSYMGALSSLEYVNYDMKSEIIIYEDVISGYDCNLNLKSLKEFNSLEYNIMNNNWDKINTNIKDLAEDLQSYRIPLYVIKSIAYRIINITSQKLRDSDTNPINIFFENSIDIGGIISSNDPDYILNSIEVLINFIKNKYSPSLSKENLMPRAEKSNDTICKVKEYIDHNYSKYDFGVSQLALEFKKSVSYISKHFKDTYGTGLLDYINMVRIEQAKHLISQTDLSIKEIGTMIGYTNDSSFIRMFKKTTGVTPGKYKELAKVKKLCE